MQVNYSFWKDELCISSIDNLIAKYHGLSISDYSMQIRQGSSLTQAMPNDLTMFDEVKALLPDHYLDVSRKKAVRIHLGVTESKQADLDAICDRSIALLSQIAAEYTKAYPFACPLSSGYDSRLVYAFLSAAVPDLQCYTFRHPNFTEKTGDLWVPVKICADQGTKHTLIPDIKAPPEYVQAVFDIVGDYHAVSTVDLVWTYKSVFSGYANSTGDIYGQIMQNALASTVPASLAGAAYLVCKTHNYAPGAKEEIASWVEDLRACGEGASITDLFALEYRCGRWASQGSAISSVCGLASLLTANCRELILLWMQVPRKLRSRQKIHRTILGKANPDLLKYPFNPGSYLDKTNRFWPAYYAATFIKYHLGRPR